MLFQTLSRPLSPVIAAGVSYLRSELPKSGNGDATRALLEAGARGYDLGSAQGTERV